MVNKCIYCKIGLEDNSVFDVCTNCGHQVWGEKMYNAIIQNMSDARDSGDLYQGSVTDTSINSPNNPQQKSRPNNNQAKVEDLQITKTEHNSALSTLAQEAIENIETHDIQRPQENTSQHLKSNYQPHQEEPHMSKDPSDENLLTPDKEILTNIEKESPTFLIDNKKSW
jgi:uncharacterized UBP type Zn finger protein